MKTIINLRSLPHQVYHDLNMLDETYIGTKNYMGLGYFWATDYKFTMRDVSVAVRRKIHHALLKAGLELDKVSPEHAAIINRLAKVNYDYTK